MDLIQKLIDLGVRANDLWFYSKLGDRLETYEGFYLMDSYPWQVTEYGTLQSLVDYAEKNRDQKFSLSFWI